MITLFGSIALVLCLTVVGYIFHKTRYHPDQTDFLLHDIQPRTVPQKGTERIDEVIKLNETVVTLLQLSRGGMNG